MGCRMPGFPVPYYLPEFAQTHVHWIGDAIQPSHPLLPSSPFAFNLSQHQGLLQWVFFFLICIKSFDIKICIKNIFKKIFNLHQVAKVLQGMHVCVLSCFFVTLWTLACQAPLSMGFSRQEYQSGWACPPPGDLPNPGIKPISITSPALEGGFFNTSATQEAYYKGCCCCSC